MVFSLAILTGTENLHQVLLIKIAIPADKIDSNAPNLASPSRTGEFGYATPETKSATVKPIDAMKPIMKQSRV